MKAAGRVRPMTRWLPILVAATALAGCAQGPQGNRLTLADLAHETIGTFPTPKGPGALRRDRLTGAYDLAIGNTSIPVGSTGPVTIVASQKVGAEQVVVLRGSTQTCPVRYGLYAFDRNSYSAEPIGDCSAELAIGGNGKQLVASQVGAADPEMWIYGNHQTAGPILRSALFTPPPEKQQPVVAAQPVTRPASSTISARSGSQVSSASPPPQHAVIRAADASVIPADVAVPATLQRPVAGIKLDD